MGLDVTCHSVCGEQLSSETCIGFSGCRWDDAGADAQCLPAEAGGGATTIWVGVVLSLVAGVPHWLSMRAIFGLHVLALSAFQI